MRSARGHAAREQSEQEQESRAALPVDCRPQRSRESLPVFMNIT